MAHPSFEAPGWRWLKAKVWGLEHAFERAKAAGKAEDDTRIRIFFVLALFSASFAMLAVGATRAALFSDVGHGNGLVGPVGAARADLTDRNGQRDNLSPRGADLYKLNLETRELVRLTRQQLTPNTGNGQKSFTWTTRMRFIQSMVL